MLSLLAILAAPPALAAPPGWVPDARFGLALYCNPTCEDAVLDGLESDLATIPDRRRLPRQARAATRATGMAPISAFAPPEPEVLELLSDTLTPSGREVLAGAQEVLVVTFAAPRPEVEPLLAQAYGAFARAARETGGVVEELASFRLYDPERFEAHATALAHAPLDATRFFVLEVVADGEDAEQATTATVTTRGLRTLGLHELVMESVAVDEVDDATAVLNTLAQVAWERGFLGSRTAVSEAAVALPDAQRRAVGLSGTVTATALAPAWGTDDPRVQVTWDGVVDAAPLQPAAFYGVPEEAPPETAAPEADPSPEAVEEPPAEVPPEVPPPEAVPPADPTVGEPPAPAPASDGAPVALPSPAPPRTLDEALLQAARSLAGPVRRAWDAGLAPGETLFVKAPFQAEDGRLEYLWLQVTSWDGTEMVGVLRSSPAWVVGLSPGDAVSVRQEAVFDYLLRRADGTVDGNGTEPFLAPDR